MAAGTAGIYTPLRVALLLTCHPLYRPASPSGAPNREIPPTYHPLNWTAATSRAHLLTCLHQCPHHKAGCPAGLVMKPPSGLAGIQRGRAWVDGQAEDGGHLRRGPGAEQGAPVEAEGQQLQAGRPWGIVYMRIGIGIGASPQPPHLEIREPGEYKHGHHPPQYLPLAVKGGRHGQACGAEGQAE